MLWSLARADSRLAFVMLAVAFGSSAACSTSYQPRPSAQVGFVIHHGAAMYVKNGQRVPVGPLAGDLEALVASSPPAAERARRAHRQLLFGVPLYVGGAATVIVGLVLASNPVGWIVLGVGATSGGTGLGLIGAGFTNALDAVNIHNDSVSAPAVTP